MWDWHHKSQDHNSTCLIALIGLRQRNQKVADFSHSLMQWFLFLNVNCEHCFSLSCNPNGIQFMDVIALHWKLYGRILSQRWQSKWASFMCNFRFILFLAFQSSPTGWHWLRNEMFKIVGSDAHFRLVLFFFWVVNTIFGNCLKISFFFLYILYHSK